MTTKNFLEYVVITKNTLSTLKGDKHPVITCKNSPVVVISARHQVAVRGGHHKGTFPPSDQCDWCCLDIGIPRVLPGPAPKDALQQKISGVQTVEHKPVALCLAFPELS